MSRSITLRKEDNRWFPVYVCWGLGLGILSTVMGRAAPSPPMAPRPATLAPATPVAVAPPATPAPADLPPPVDPLPSVPPPSMIGTSRPDTYQSSTYERKMDEEERAYRQRRSAQEQARGSVISSGSRSAHVSGIRAMNGSGDLLLS